MFVVTVIVSVLLAGAVLGAGGSKLAGVPAMKESAAHLGFSYPSYQRIGALEVAGGLGVLLGLAVAPLGVLAAVCLALLLVLAVVAHVRKGDGPQVFGAAAVLAVLSVVAAVLRAATA